MPKSVDAGCWNLCEFIILAQPDMRRVQELFDSARHGNERSTAVLSEGVRGYCASLAAARSFAKLREQTHARSKTTLVLDRSIRALPLDPLN